jgi:DNA-binding LacI/PurR family transcriptional regulator
MEHAGAQISGVRQPVEKYAAAAVETLTREINEPGSAPVKILFPGEFIERSSL